MLCIKINENYMRIQFYGILGFCQFHTKSFLKNVFVNQMQIP